MPGSTPDVEALTQRLLAGEGSRYAPWRDLASCRRALAETGLPQQRSEAWQHTNIGRWYRAVRSHVEPRPPDGSDDAAALSAVAAPGSVQVAGFAASNAPAFAQAQPARTADPSRHPLVAVNGLLLEAGVVVRVPALAHDGPVSVGPLPGRFQHVLVAVAAGADVVLVEEPASYAHRLVEVVVGEGASVLHQRRQGPSSGAECSLVAVHVAERGRYRLAQSCRGAALRRNDVEVTLAAGAEAIVAAAWRLAARDHLDNQVTVRHAAPDGSSRQTYRGVASGQARAVLGGRIHIAAEADGTDAALSSKNLIAGDRAQVFAKPVLEIHASDVRCAHGATVGALDEAAIHYLRCRGIAETAARDLLVRGFLREAIADPAGEALLGLAA